MKAEEFEALKVGSKVRATCAIPLDGCFAETGAEGEVTALDQGFDLAPDSLIVHVLFPVLDDGENPWTATQGLTETVLLGRDEALMALEVVNG